GRTDDLRHELTTRGIEEERIGHGVPRCPGPASREEDLAQPFAEPGPTRLAGHEHVEAEALEHRRSTSHLGGLAGALGPFERDEPASAGRYPGSRHAAECSRRSWRDQSITEAVTGASRAPRCQRRSASRDRPRATSRGSPDRRSTARASRWPWRLHRRPAEPGRRAVIAQP